MPLLTSIHGRRFGLDENGAPVANQTRTGTKVAGTSDSTGVTLANNGFVSVTSSTDDAWTLADPYQGAVVTLFINSTSTGVHTIGLNNSVAYTSVGTAGSTITLSGPGASITLYGMSTGVWLPIGRNGSSGSAYAAS
jgi:hypothetical protein